MKKDNRGGAREGSGRPSEKVDASTVSFYGSGNCKQALFDAVSQHKRPKGDVIEAALLVSQNHQAEFQKQLELLLERKTGKAQEQEQS